MMRDKPFACLNRTLADSAGAIMPHRSGIRLRDEGMWSAGGVSAGSAVFSIILSCTPGSAAVPISRRKVTKALLFSHSVQSRSLAAEHPCTPEALLLTPVHLIGPRQTPTRRERRLSLLVRVIWTLTLTLTLMLISTLKYLVR